MLEQRRLLTAVSWVASTSGAWSTPANWSTGIVPQTGDDVTINKAGSIQVNLTGNTSVNSLTISGDTLSVSGATLSVAASSSVGSAASLTLSSNAVLSLASAASLTNSGAITVNPGSQLNVGSAYTETSTGTLTLPSGILASGIGTNLLGNSGFEAPSAGTSTTTGPNIWGQWGSSYVSSAYNHSGGQALLQSGSNSGVSQSFAVSPGVSYSASVYALTPSTDKLTGKQGGFVNITFTNSSGGTISSPQQFITVLNSNSTAGVWVNSTTSITAPAGAVSINFDLQLGPYTNGSGTAGGSVAWDDIQLGPTAINTASVTAASVSNSGTVTVGAGDTLAVTGAFTQTATGILFDQLGGPAAGNFYGRLTAGGSATLAGTLKATLVNSYSPAINDGFTLLSYASQSGTFATYQLPSAAAYTFQAGVNPTYVGISAVPVSFSTSINAASKISSSNSNLVGTNLALWDGYLNTTQSQQIVQAAGLSLLRFPGGSGADDYHFNVQNNYGYSSNTIPQFAQFISAVGATGMSTVDYGSGSPQEASAELAYLEGSTTDTTSIGTGIEWSDSAGVWQNVNWGTVGYWAGLRAAKPLATDDGLNFMRINKTAPYTNIKYWEIGNEIYYSWETDHHGTPGPGGVSTGAQHDPATYAAFVTAFSNFAASDPLLPAIQVGIDDASPDGTTDNFLMKTVVTDIHNDGAVPGFISDHVYMQGPGSENDSFLLNGTVSNPSSLLDWSTRYTDYKTMLQQVLGTSAAAGVNIMATEFNSNYGTEGKQMTSLVNGLFIADSVGSLLNSGYTAGLVWDLRNGWTTSGNNSPTLYGWRQGGDEGLIGSYGTAPSTGPYIAYPNYYAEQLASKIMQNGGSGLSAVSTYDRLAVYSAMEPNGHLEMMVLNKNPQANLTEQFNLSGFTPSGQASVWQYGEAQDYAQSQSTNGAAALANFSTSLSLTGNNFSYAFPAYSMTVLDLAPKLTLATAAAAAPTLGIVGTPISLSALGLENGGDTSLTYTWAATGPASVSYSGTTNGTNAARNISANFSLAGNYTFVVTVTDPGGQTVTSSVQITVLPLFASQTGSVLSINLNNVAPISVTTSSGSIIVTESGYPLSFSGVTSVIVNGSATNNVLNLNSVLTAPANFTNDSTTTLNVNSGTLTIAAGTGSSINNQLFSSINIAASAKLMLAAPPSPSGRTLLSTQLLTIAGTIGNWTGKLDLNGNDLEVQNGDLTDINNQVQEGYNPPAGNWQGSGGVVNSAAAGDTTRLTTLGVILNTIDGTPASAPLFSNSKLFDGTAPPATAVLIKSTYYGDANLDGTVDGSDYTRIDSGFLARSTGWFNGDINCDGVIDGSDYTLMDNAFNTQGAARAASIATAGTTAVESASPAGAGLKKSLSQALRPAPSAAGVDPVTGQTLIVNSIDESIELRMKKRDHLDQITS